VVAKSSEMAPVDRNRRNKRPNAMRVRSSESSYLLAALIVMSDKQSLHRG